MIGAERNHAYLPPAILLGLVILVALGAPLLPLADPIRQDVAHRLSGPSAAHWLGQDEYGRDVFSRLIWGARASLAVAFLAALLAGVVGTVLGLLGGYFRSIVEIVTVRLSEIVLCFPPMLLALLVVTLLGPGTTTLVLVLALLFAPGFARVAFAETLSARSLDYIAAQQALGAGNFRVIFRTILPNIAPPLLVQFSLTVASAMVLESGLSFLGLGVVPPAPSWGLMIRGARSAMDHAPLLLLWPCLALSGTVLLLNLLCDKLRDALDPRGDQVGVLPGFLRGGLTAAKPDGKEQPGRLLEVDRLTLAIQAGDKSVALVRDVSFTVASGETLAIVGESGSGKTLTALSLMGLLPGAIVRASGHARFVLRNGDVRDLLAMSEPALRGLRGDQLSMVFQDASSSLNPVRRIGGQIAEPIQSHGKAGVRETARRVVALLKQVGLPDAERRRRVFPHEISGGQRQRVMIAAAVANAPRLLIADEPTTALDVTVQAQILDLLADLKARDAEMAMIFVTHNLAVVSEIADRVVVMYAGEVIESGPVATVFASPRHPYTVALISSVPEGRNERLTAIPGAVPSPFARPTGCSFAPRCAMAMDECRKARPEPVSIGEDRMTRCIRWKEVA